METDQDGIEIKSTDGIGDESKDVVSHASFKKLLDQRKADQEKLRKAQEELDSFKAKEKELEEKKLAEQGNWKALLEAREAKLKESEEKINLLSDSLKTYETKVSNAIKLDAFERAIGGKLKNKVYYDTVFAPEKIALNPETGEVDDASVKEYATFFVNNFKETIEFKGAKLPNDAAKTSGKLSHAEWTELARTNPKEARLRMKDVQ